MLTIGVNPKGLMPNHIWQVDVTHVPSFGNLQYGHVSVVRFFHHIFASVHFREKVKDVKSLCLHAFAYTTVHKELKTDHGPAYMSSGLKQSCEVHGITLKTGIPYNQQAVVEHTHHTLKGYLGKVKKRKRQRPYVANIRVN